MALPKKMIGETGFGEVMKPYQGDPEARGRRRARRWLIGSVIAFCLIYGVIYALFTPYFLPVIAMPVVLLMALVVWALPDLKHPPIPAMEWLFFATIAELVVWPNYLAIALPGLPWITVSRLTGFPFAFLLAVCVSTSSEFRRRSWAAMQATPLIWRLLVAFVLI